MAAYLLLALAIVAEVSGTVSLKLSEGFSRLGPSLVVVLGYGIAFTAMALVLKLGMPIGVAYAIWAAAGVALVAIIGVVFFQEKVTIAMIGGLALIISGVVLLEVGSAS